MITQYLGQLVHAYSVPIVNWYKAIGLTAAIIQTWRDLRVET
ncbi:hypothetical protein PSE_p0043 (plasmid) [Pseudovibrio sp. FO-BEG1]|nr:hypothetical protein PSE_p0043 [Pseudovibrio sp. FO-BEG1]